MNRKSALDRSAFFDLRDQREKLQENERLMKNNLHRIQNELAIIKGKIAPFKPQEWEKSALIFCSLEELFAIQTEIEWRFGQIRACSDLWHKKIPEDDLKYELIDLLEKYRCRYCKKLGHHKDKCPKLELKDLSIRRREEEERKQEERRRIREDVERTIKAPKTLPFVRVQQEDCPICLQPFTDKDTIEVLSCFHYFHVSCYDTYSKTQERQPCPCPICRQE